ncbi:hypothetical protein OSTOST_19378 [Ostertagia ostertagi]
MLGDPSAPTTWVKTPPAPPSEAVESLKWKALDNVTILVEWDPVETAHQSGDHLRYRLSWSLDKEVEQDNSSQERKFLAHHIGENRHKTPQAIVRLNATEECRMLVFSVRPVNDQGVGATSTDTVAFVNSKGEPRRVLFTNATTVLNSTHASFSWDWEKTNECGRAHAVQLTCTPPEDDPLTVTISGEFSEWTLGGLSADTKYECVFRPLNAEVQESEAGYTTIIEWSAIAFPQGNFTDAASGYKIFVYVSETASEAVVLTMPHQSPLESGSTQSTVAGYNSGGTASASVHHTIKDPTTRKFELDFPSTMTRSIHYETRSAFLAFIVVALIIVIDKSMRFAAICSCSTNIEDLVQATPFGTSMRIPVVC